MIRSFFIILVLTFCISTVDGFSQDVEGRVMAVNEVLAPSYNVERKGSNILISGFREGKLVKVEKVGVHDLDIETLKISTVDGTVSIKCYSDFEGCVARTLMRERKKKSYRSRIVFGIDEDKSGEEIAEKLRLLMVDLAQKN